MKEANWKNIWAGDWNLLDCSDWGEHYLSTLKVNNRPFLDTVAFVIKNGKSSCWVDSAKLQKSAEKLVQIYSSKKKIQHLSELLKFRVDLAMRVMATKGGINQKVYNSYRQSIRDYYVPHFYIKYIVDSLPEKKRAEFLPILQKARVYAESVFAETLKFDRKLAKVLSNKTRIKPELLLCLTKDELNHFFESGKLPKILELRKRHTFSVLMIQSDKTYKIYTGRKAKQQESKLFNVKGQGILRGQSAYPGIAKGRAWIIYDPKRAKGFTKGNILVTGMTRPEFLPLMHKAAAFVTDAGGILSHAAITARELKKPCVIGTQIATRVLKDGAIVEVDANKGIVKILS
jgi:phosphohistidine swiveling domain-containing protein